MPSGVRVGLSTVVLQEREERFRRIAGTAGFAPLGNRDSGFFCPIVKAVHRSLVISLGIVDADVRRCGIKFREWIGCGLLFRRSLGRPQQLRTAA